MLNFFKISLLIALFAFPSITYSMCSSQDEITFIDDIIFHLAMADNKVSEVASMLKSGQFPTTNKCQASLVHWIDDKDLHECLNAINSNEKLRIKSDLIRKARQGHSKHHVKLVQGLAKLQRSQKDKEFGFNF